MNKCLIGDLPIWLGAQPTATVETAPFGFVVGEHGLVRMANRDIVARMVESYSIDGYQFITSPPGASDWGNELARKSISGLIDTYGAIDGKHVLEVGGGTLYSAEIMISEFGAASVTIVDPAATQTTSSKNITVIREYFGQKTKLDQDFDLIVSFNTLEHVPDPIHFLQALADKLSHSAKLYLKMPECRDSFMMGDLGLCVHEHLSYFTPSSLDACLSVAGLKRVADANYQGALQVLVEKSTPDPQAQVSESVDLLKAFSIRYPDHLAYLADLVDRQAWKAIAFVGCSVGLCNMLHLTRLSTRVNVGLFDNDHLKEGRYLPGVNRPIAVPGKTALEGYDAIFVVPVNFFNPIKAGLVEMLGTESPEILPVFQPS